MALRDGSQRMSGSNGRTRRRGYGAKHQALRKALEQVVEAGGALCSRCGRLIEPGEPWDAIEATLPHRRFRDSEARLFPDSGADALRMAISKACKPVTANTYSHVLLDEAELHYADLLAA